MCAFGFETLPREIILSIIKFLPDLASLASLVKASPTTANLFDNLGAEIIDDIISCNVPEQIKRLIRLVIWVQCTSSTTGIPTLHEFIQEYVHEHGREVPPRISRGTPLPILHGILETARQIDLLTQSCLYYYLDRCMVITPSRLADPDYSYHDSPQSPWRQRPEGKRYEPECSGPPSWIEEQRVARALWHVQLFHDLTAAIANGRLNWPDSNIEALQKNWTSYYATPHYEEALTVIDYLQDLTGGLSKGDGIVPLDRASEKCHPPPSFEKFRASSSTPCATGTAQNYKDLYRLSSGCLFGRLMSEASTSPLRYSRFEPFRRFGFAIWDPERMAALGMAFHRAEGWSQLTFPGLYFTWRSILSDDELDKMDRRADAFHSISSGR